MFSGTYVSASTHSLNSSMIDGGTIQSVNITDSEYSSPSSGSVPSIIIGDGKISNIWSKVSPHAITSFGPNGYIKSVYGKNTIYFLMVQDPSYSWIACEWDSTNTSFANIQPMEVNDDLWIFGPSPHGFYGDAYSIGQGYLPVMDNVSNIHYEKVIVNDTKGNPISIDWEVSRSYVTNDYAGHDIQFTNQSNPYYVLFASEVYHKLESKITESTFVFSNLKLGQVGATTTSTNTNPILVDRHLNTQNELGLISAIVLVIFTIYVPIFLKIIKRR